MEGRTPLVCATRRSSLATIAGLSLTLTACQSLETVPTADAVGTVVDMDAVCSAGDDVFANDGDGVFVHFVRLGERLVEVRRIGTNPDVEACAVGTRAVYFVDPEFGVLAFDRNAESDIVLQPVYLKPPAGRGTLTPTSIEIVAPNQLVIGDASGASEAIAIPAAPRATMAEIHASAETAPVQSSGDAADDSVVVPYRDSAWIVAADKTYGIRVYDLDGNERQSMPLGRINNVDAHVAADGRILVAGSNRTDRSLTLVGGDTSDATASFRHLADVPLTLDDPYGLCMAELGGEVHVFVGGKDGTVERWQVTIEGAATLVATIRFGSQTEGCTVDTETGILYVGEEERGIWAVDPDSGDRTLFAAVDNDLLVADVEGLDVYRGESARWLLASSQGNDSFVLFALHTDSPPTRFRVVADPGSGIDGVSETDGLAIYAKPLPGYPSGIVVLQDGRNVMPQAPQNFKILPWEAIPAL